MTTTTTIIIVSFIIIIVFIVINNHNRSISLTMIVMPFLPCPSLRQLTVLDATVAGPYETAR